MEKKSQDFSMEEVRQAANSPEARQLLELMRQRNPAAVAEAAQQAASGDFSQALRAMQKLMADPAIQDRLQKMGLSHGRP